METNKLTQVIAAILLIGLLGTAYLYTNTNKDLTRVTSINQQLETQLDTITGQYREIITQLETLQESNTDLNNRVTELETALEIAEAPIIVEENIVNLDIDTNGTLKNIILLIGDGMGVGQLTAAELENGDETLAISGIPYKSMVTTYSASNFVTDSAAAATALATGYKTNNGKISMSPSSDILKTVLELAESKGYSTGLVTNTRVTHATPACFVAHVSDRGMESVIANQILESDVDVVLGGGSTYFSGIDPASFGFTLVTSTVELLAVDSGRVLGLFTPRDRAKPNRDDPQIHRPIGR
jgi:alkaline phosphatase